ncbi:MAG TPA: alpha/beta hydrolase family protein [Sphaerochaeta sp.]|nr:alpha/beta hydrolase family protein [Sphaerochaeta sp.]
MALIHLSLYSDTLMMDTSVTVIFPQDCQRIPDNRKSLFKGPYKVLYLLHGLKQDETSWIRMSSIERYVSQLPLVVVMPSVHRSFYTDQVRGFPYFSYVADELPRIMKEMFNISDRREDTFVAGLSMGGYGAFKLALSRPEQYGYAASLSGALDLVGLRSQQEDTSNDAEMENTFGDLDRVEGSGHDLFALAKDVGTLKPELFMSCGTEDFVYEGNVHFHETFSETLPITYHEESGDHSWQYWDRNIKRVLFWLPIIPESNRNNLCC